MKSSPLPATSDTNSQSRQPLSSRSVTQQLAEETDEAEQNPRFSLLDDDGRQHQPEPLGESSLSSSTPTPGSDDDETSNQEEDWRVQLGVIISEALEIIDASRMSFLGLNDDDDDNAGSSSVEEEAEHHEEDDHRSNDTRRTEQQDECDNDLTHTAAGSSTNSPSGNRNR